MSVLGHVIQNTGSINEDFRQTEVRMWKSFWGNAGKLKSRRFAQKYKISLLQRATVPIADQHMVRWPYTRAKATLVDRMQRRMLAVTCKVDGFPGEDAAEFVKRRNRAASALQQSMGKWSVRWARQVHLWHGHVLRDPNFWWPSQLLPIRSPQELQTRRGLWHRPRTRCLPGYTYARWCEHVELATATYRRSLGDD